jgi:hypothetical protein
MTLGAVTGTQIAAAILGRDPMLDPSLFAPSQAALFCVSSVNDHLESNAAIATTH